MPHSIPPLDCRVCRVGVLVELDRGLYCGCFVCGHCGASWCLELQPLTWDPPIRRSGG